MSTHCALTAYAETTKDGNAVAFVPELAGLHATGKTEQEALSKLRAKVRAILWRAGQKS